MKLVETRITLNELESMAEAGFGDLVKAVVDYFLGDNRFGSTGSSWRSYFHAYGLAAATKKESAC